MRPLSVQVVVRLHVTLARCFGPRLSNHTSNCWSLVGPMVPLRFFFPSSPPAPPASPAQRWIKYVGKDCSRKDVISILLQAAEQEDLDVTIPPCAGGVGPWSWLWAEWTKKLWSITSAPIWRVPYYCVVFLSIYRICERLLLWLTSHRHYSWLVGLVTAVVWTYLPSHYVHRD